jgi:hypothetical protein
MEGQDAHIEDGTKLGNKKLFPVLGLNLLNRLMIFVMSTLILLPLFLLGGSFNWLYIAFFILLVPFQLKKYLC